MVLESAVNSKINFVCVEVNVMIYIPVNNFSVISGYFPIFLG